MLDSVSSKHNNARMQRLLATDSEGRGISAVSTAEGLPNGTGGLDFSLQARVDSKFSVRMRQRRGLANGSARAGCIPPRCRS
jgi:hypothetical protein